MKAIKTQPMLELLVDQEGLTAGDRWKTTIFGWMEKAHASLILLSDDALKSDWVAIEASILAFMAHQGRTFKLIPVVLTKRADFRDKLIGKLALTDSIVFIKPGNPRDAASKVVSTLCEPAFVSVVQRLSPARLSLHEYVVNQLKKITFDEQCLNEVRTCLPDASPEPQPRSADDARSLFAWQIINADFFSACHALEQLSAILDCSNLNHDTVIHELGVVLNSAWISEHDASTVAEAAAAKNSEDRRLTMLSIDDVYVRKWAVESAVRRSCGRPVTLKAEFVDVLPPTHEDSLEHITQTIRQHMDGRMNGCRHSRRLDPDNRELKDLIKELHNENLKRIFLTMHQWPLDAEFIKRFRADFPTPTLLLPLKRNPTSMSDPPIPSLMLTPADADSSHRRWCRFVCATTPGGGSSRE